MRAADMIEHLVGQQAQVPKDPYLGLWSRLEAFDPLELSGMMETRRAVRAALMRGTIHLVTAQDMLTLRPLMTRVLDRLFFTASPFGRALGDVDVDEVATAGRALVEERPLTRVELAAALGARWPDMARPRSWTCDRGQGSPVSERFDRLRSGLRIFHSEGGRELFDLPDAPRPEPDTPAPPRFLPSTTTCCWASQPDREALASEGAALLTLLASETASHDVRIC